MALRIILNLPIQSTRLSNRLCLRKFNVTSSITTMKKHRDFNNGQNIQELNVRLKEIMGVESGYKPIPVMRHELIKYLPKSQADLPKRSMRDSYLTASIPLSTDLVLQDKYITFLGQVRVGRLLEDMDIFAVMVAAKHIVNIDVPEDVPLPQTLVTAAVDRIDFTDFVPKPQEEIKISGHVSWVGKSSMEVMVQLDQLRMDTWHNITKAVFLIAARDPTNTSPAVVNPLVPDGEREQEIFSGGELRKKMRFASKAQHVTKAVPNLFEQKIIHDLYIRTTGDKESLKNIVLPGGAVWMEDWTLFNTIFSQPENRNLHNTVFGGFLMRQACELSWVLGYKFSKYRPKVNSISDITFSKPIAVNSLIHMYAHVVYTHLNFIQITVFVEIFNPNTGISDTTNSFHFTYEVPEVVREVIPKTYNEAMMYIDGRRHFLQTFEGRGHGAMLNEEGIINKSKL